jgi:Domain of unknown function (DUF5666)
MELCFILCGKTDHGENGFVVFSGTVTFVASPNLIVGGRTVITTAQTKFSGAGAPASLADLKVGDRVAVTGQLQADGSVLAIAIVRLP